jgi:beta-galactosidase
MRGLDRHQAYPYIGYAAPESLQREDARILKEELCLNAVRTSHYPQSQYFIDACDELGLLVFTEIPGWQHIGDDAWQKQAVDNVREMVIKYRNHPSIVLWGVRINESRDNDALYEKTNALAHLLDPSRQTSGVRYLVKSHLIEDVYAYNDFKPFDFDDPIRKKDKITTDPEKGYLISEHS